MKRFLAIILAVAMVMSMAVVVSAAPEGYEVGPCTKANFGTAGWNSTYDAETSVITYEGTWKGCGWWIDNYLTYDSMIIEFPGAEIAAQVVVDYGDGNNKSFDVAVGATSVTVAIDATSKVAQIYIQNKGDEGLTLTLGDVYMREYIPETEAEPIEVNVSNPQKTDDNKNIAFNVGQALPSGETYTVHIKGTTDTDFRIWLGSLNNAASDVAKCFMNTTEFEFIEEITTTGVASTVTLKVFNGAESDNYKNTLAGVKVTELVVFPGTKADYEAYLASQTKLRCAKLFEGAAGEGSVTVYVETTAVEYNESLVLKLVDANGEVLTETMRNPDRATSYPNGLGCSIFVRGECTDGWLQTSWTPEADKAPATVELWLDGKKTTSIAVDLNGYDWPTSDVIGVELEGNAPVEEGRKSGYIVTGEETHAIIIGKAIITTNHELDVNGDCLYCRYHRDAVVEETVSDDIVIEQPTESTEEETEDITVNEPVEDTNPGTGIALAVIPMIMAAAAVVISKR